MLTTVRSLLLVLLLLLTLPVEGQERQQRDPFKQWDRNADGFLSPAEFPRQLGKQLFDRIDANKDGRLSRKEDDAFRARRNPGNNRERRPARLPEGITLQRDVVYATLGKRKLGLDLYLPKKTDKP